MTSSGADAGDRLVLDTSAFSRFRHGHSEVLDLLSAAEIVFRLEDVRGDDWGAGDIVYPERDDMERGDLDLLRIAHTFEQATEFYRQQPSICAAPHS